MTLPPALRPQSSAAIMSQARRLVGQTYAPAYAALNTQQSQLQAINDKRKADNAAYQQWLLGKQADYNSKAAAAQQQYMTYLDGLRSTVEQQHQAAQQGATAAVQGQPGTVSNMQQSTALQGLSADTARATGLVDNARAQTAAMLPSLEMRQNARQQAVIGQGQADEAKRTNDFNAGLSNINAQRFKLDTGKAADVLKNYAAGMTQQIDIANANRNYQTALGALGIKAANAQLGQDRLTLDQQKANNAQGNANRNYNLNVAKEKNRVSLANKRLQQAARNRNNPVMSPKDQAKAYQAVQTVSGLLGGLHNDHPDGLVPVFGTTIDPTTQQKVYKQTGTNNFREQLRSQGYSDTQIDVAIDLYAHNGKLSPFGAKQAKALGIQNPYAKFGKADIGTSYNGPH